MKFSENEGTVTLEMTRQQYAKLLVAIGIAHESCTDRTDSWKWLQFLNELNAGNATFIPYEVPVEFRGQPWEKLHEEMGCVHPPGCVQCSWCGMGIKAPAWETK